MQNLPKIPDDPATLSVTLHIDPKLVFGLRLLARKRKQTISQTLRQIVKDAIDGRLGDGV